MQFITINMFLYRAKDRMLQITYRQSIDKQYSMAVNNLINRNKQGTKLIQRYYYNNGD